MTEQTTVAPSGSPVRIDKWLWAVRLCKTRAVANEACSSGRVRIDGAPAKPAHRVKPGATVTVRTRGVTRTYQVVRTIDKRVGAPVAATCYHDQTPPEALPRAGNAERIDAAWAERERGSGRPTKRDRRQIEKFLRRQR